jgi:hypothetical protein
MNAIFQSIFAVVMGLALFIYGIIHSVTRYPGSLLFSRLMESLPVVWAVGLFLIGIIVTLAGVALLLFSLRRLRRNWRALRMLTDPRRGYTENGGEQEWAYR